MNKISSLFRNPYNLIILFGSTLVLTFSLGGLVAADDHEKKEESKDIYGLEVSSVYQLVDDEEAPIDFQSANITHQCGGNPSNHFRVYSDDPVVAQRKFHIILSALNHGHILALQPKGCEGKRMLVGWVRASR